MSLQIENKIELDFENAFCDNGLKFKDIIIDDENKKYKIVKRINKKGELVEYKYEDVYKSDIQKIRSKNNYEKNKDDYLKKIKCDVCNKEISKTNYKKHIYTDKHKLNEQKNKN